MIWLNPDVDPNSYRIYTVDGLGPGDPGGGTTSDDYQGELATLTALDAGLKPGQVVQLTATDADWTDLDCHDDPNAICVDQVEWDVLAEARG